MPKVLVVLALLAALAAVPATAGADSGVVQHERSSIQDSYVDSSLCSFPVTVSVTANIDDALFFDANGDLVRVLETVNRVSFSYSANGNTLNATGTGGIELLFHADGSVTANTFGINLLLTIPGTGTVFLDAGRATYLFDPHIHVLFHAGPASYDLAAFCSALAATP
jgi:hypothetical protein